MNILNKNIKNNFDLLDFLILILPISIFSGNLIININIFFIILIGIKNFYSKILNFLSHNYKKTLLFSVVILINLILSNEIVLTIKGDLNLIKNTILSIVIYFWLSKKQTNLKKLFNFIIISSVIVVLSIYFDFFYKNINNINYDRLSGIFFDEKVAGSYISKFIIIFCLYIHIFGKKNPFNQYVYLLIFFFTYISILLTGDRTPIFISSIAIFLLLLFQKKIFSVKKHIVIFILLISFIFSYSASNQFRHKISYTLSELGLNKKLLKYTDILNQKLYSDDKMSLWTKYYHERPDYYETYEIKLLNNQRFSHFAKAYEIGKSNLIIGSGIKSFRNECYKPEYTSNYLNQFDNAFSCATHPHNIYFEFFSETGIVGLFIFIFVIFFLCSKVLNIKNYEIKILLIFKLFIYFFPLQPTGSFFSTFNGVFYFISIPIIIYLSNYSINYQNNYQN
tara:strand:- start:1631 stop:2983 length:1353 start_codon:yes stop_codon:yes gene_type:complete